jgi:hypothetical protein
VSGTVNARFGLEEMPPDSPRLPRWLSPLGFLFALALVVVVCVQMIRGAADEYQSKIVALQAAEARAAKAEGQLAEMLKHGDAGILVANIGPDLAGYQLRLVPQQFKGRKQNHE